MITTIKGLFLIKVIYFVRDDFNFVQLEYFNFLLHTSFNAVLHLMKLM